MSIFGDRVRAKRRGLWDDTIVGRTGAEAVPGGPLYVVLPGSSPYYWRLDPQTGEVIWNRGGPPSVSGTMCVTAIEGGGFYAISSTSKFMRFDENADLLWEAFTGRGEGGIAMASDGTPYLGVGQGSAFGAFQKYDPDTGAQIWSELTCNFRCGIWDIVLSESTGFAYFGAGIQNQHRLHRKPLGGGQLEDMLTGGSTGVYGLAIDEGAGVLYSSEWRGVRKFDHDKNTLWFVNYGVDIAPTPRGIQVLPDGNIVVGSGDKVTKRSASSGAVIWEIMAPGEVHSVQVSRAGGIYYSARHGVSLSSSVYRIDGNGNTLWEAPFSWPGATVGVLR